MVRRRCQGSQNHDTFESSRRADERQGAHWASFDIDENRQSPKPGRTQHLVRAAGICQNVDASRLLRKPQASTLSAPSVILFEIVSSSARLKERLAAQDWKNVGKARIF